MENKIKKSFWRTLYLNLYLFGLRKEVFVLIENLYSLLSSGMNIIEALSAIQEEINIRRLRLVVQKIQNDVESGVSFSKSLEAWNLFPERTLSLIRLGELSGKLVDNLEIVVLQNEKDQVFRSKLRSSLMYATIILTAAIVIGSLTSWYVLPRIITVFESMNAELPLVTKILIALGRFLQSYGYIFVPIFLTALILFFYFFFSFPKTKFIGHSILFHTPLIKTLILDVELSRCGFMLGTMIQAGLPIVEALKSMPGTTTYHNYQKFYRYLEQSLAEGNSFKRSFENYPKAQKLFPVAVRQMIISGEKSGRLASALLSIGRRYELKLEDTARDLPIIIEPLLILIIGAGVALFALGIIWPIYSLVQII